VGRKRQFVGESSGLESVGAAGGSDPPETIKGVGKRFLTQIKFY